MKEFVQLVKNNKWTYENIWKFATGQCVDCKTGCLVEYSYFKKYYKLIAKYFGKKQKLDADPKATKQINFTGNLEKDNGAISFFFKKWKKHFEFFTRNRESGVILLCFIIISI